MNIPFEPIKLRIIVKRDYVRKKTIQLPPHFQKKKKKHSTFHHLFFQNASLSSLSFFSFFENNNDCVRIAANDPKEVRTTPLRCAVRQFFENFIISAVRCSQLVCENELLRWMSCFMSHTFVRWTLIIWSFQTDSVFKFNASDVIGLQKSSR